MHLTELIEKKGFVLTTELCSIGSEEFAERVKHLVDAITITSLRNTFNAESISIQTASWFKEEKFMDAVPTITCRDYSKEPNRVMELKRQGLTNLLVLYGDRNSERYGNRYEFSCSSELIQWMREQEEKLKATERFCFGVASNPSRSVAAEVRSLEGKAEAGAEFTITQPVFSMQRAMEFVDLVKRHTGLKVVVGLLILKSFESAKKVEQRLGIAVPRKVKDRLAENPLAGFDVCREIVNKLRGKVDGFHVFPYGNREAALKLLWEIKMSNQRFM